MPKPIAKLGAGYGVSISSDQASICITSNSAPARLVDLEDFEVRYHLKGQPNARKTLFTDDESIYVIGFDSGFARFSTRTGDLIAKARSKHIETEAHQVSPSGSYVVTAQRGKIGLYRSEDMKRAAWLELDDETFGKPLVSMFDPSESHVAVFWSTGINEFCRYFVSTFSLKDYGMIGNAPVPIKSDSFHPTPVNYSGELLTVCMSSCLVTLNTQTGTVVQQHIFPPTDSSRYSCARKIPDTDRLLCTFDNQALVVDTNLSPLCKPFLLPIEDELYDVAISPRNDCLVTCTGKVHVWALDDLEYDPRAVG